MARLAGLLGRRFEARAYLTVATAVFPNRKEFGLELARLRSHDQTTKATGKTLADLLTPELGDDRLPTVRLSPGRNDP